MNNAFAQAPRPHRLTPLFEARSVAIVNASGDSAKPTGRPLSNMLLRDFPGELYPVNALRTRVQGLPCHTSLSAIGQPVDLALIAAPSHEVEALLRDGIDAGVKAFALLSSDHDPSSTAGQALLQRLHHMSRQHGVPILGPNSQGVINSANTLIASHTAGLDHVQLKRGGFAFVGQHSTLDAHWLDLVLQSELGISSWISTGDECDVDAAEAIDYLVSDANTRVIGVHLKHVRDPAKLHAALARAAVAGKPVITIQSGAAKADPHDPDHALCLSTHGALWVASLTEMLEVARLFLHNAVPQGNKLAVLTTAQAPGAWLAEACVQHHLVLPALQPNTAAGLRTVLPEPPLLSNPLPLSGSLMHHVNSLGHAMKAIAAHNPEVDAIVLFTGLQHGNLDAMARSLALARAQIEPPIIVIWLGALPHAVRQLHAKGIPTFSDAPEALRALHNARRIMRLQAHATAQPVASAAPVHQHAEG